MSRITRYFCDECGVEFPKTQLIQWAGCYQNRYHCRDFCGYPCGEAFKAKAIEHCDHGRGYTDEGPRGSDCACRGTDKMKECANMGCGFCIAEIYKDQN